MPTLNESSKQYSYNEMSNKVISSRRNFHSKDENSLPSSLAGQISINDMGTRAVKEPQPKIQKTPVEKKIQYSYSGTLEDISYHPTSEETEHIFNLIIGEASKILSDQSHEVIITAADTILEILKNEELSTSQKRQEINDLLDFKIDDLLFNELTNLSKRITDYDIKIVEEEEEEEADGNGVAVVFDDTDEENDGNDHLGEVLEDENDDQENNTADANEDTNVIDNEMTIRAPDNLPSSETVNTIPLFQIDQFYLQREISSLIPEEDQSNIQKLAKESMNILSNFNLGVRELENELMDLFNYEHFEFIKTCIENRWRIVFKIKLLDCNDDSDMKNKVMNQLEQLGLIDLYKEFNNEIDIPINLKKRKNSADAEVNDDDKNKKVKPVKRVPKIVDLNNYVFDEGSHLMTNKKVKLPQGSYQKNMKLYDLISVPPPTPPPQDPDEKLVNISELPEWAQVVFPKNETTSLNRIQSKIYPSAFTTDENLLLCAPTGAGKTNVAMLTILRVINNFRNPNTGKIDLNKFKVVYIAPLKALVQEQMREFQRRLTPNFGVVVNELTGDSSLSKQQISETQILITTPEKWDVITRKENNYSSFTKLIIIDEIHLLHDTRGPVLENIVSRTLRQIESTNDQVRLVGLSATLPNYKDVSRFLRVDAEKGLYYFDASYRPCPLAQQFIGIKEKKAIKKVNAMNQACYDKLQESLENGHQMIIFVHSRKDTYKTAKWLSAKLEEEDKSLNLNAGTLEILRQEAEYMMDSNLKDIVASGFGMHHAGLNKGERSVVEDLFAQGHLKVLVSTATLAWGVNLPAHTVVIKGTETYSPEKGFWVQLSPQDILQMLGRAGRPRYDTHGEGIIITTLDEIQYYLAILNQQLPIESQLMGSLSDSLNAEVVSGTVNSREDAINWLGYTYLYIRMLSSPSLYHVGPEYQNDEYLYWKRADLVHSALCILNDNKLVIYDQESGDVKCTELGRIASHFYINYETMNMYNTQIKPWFSEIDILKVFASSGEFKYIQVRQEEKLEVSKLLEKSPIPVKENPTEQLAKVNILLQTYISRLSLQGFALMADMVYITQSAGRLLRAIHEICLKKKWSSLTKITLNLCKSVEKRMWLSNSPFRQYGSLAPPEIIRATENSHLPFNNYFHLNPEELAETINLRGNSQKAYELLQEFPRLSLSYYSQPITPSLLRIEVSVVPEWNWNAKIHGNSESFLVLVEDCNGDLILYYDQLTITKKYANKEHIVEFTLPFLEPIQPNYFVNFINTKWLHSDWKIPLMLTDIKIPKKFPAYTDLLDLQGVPTSALKVDEFIETFGFNYFNKFQSQVFQTLYNSDNNVFIGMSKGNGKTTCAELAILNNWKQNKGRIVYINSNEVTINRLTRVWRKKYKHLPNKQIEKLSGNLSADIRTIASNHIVLATPEQFDLVSRRWRQRKSIQAIDLIIFDDCHMVGNGSQGVIYENIISRMRFISTQVSNPIRMIALANLLANGRGFGEWIGCLKQNIFNFDPIHRFNKIKEIKLQAFDVTSNCPTDGMIQSAYKYLRKETTDCSSLIFVPTRKDCIKIALTLLQRATDDEWDLIQQNLSDIEPYLNKLKDLSLKESISNGIGLYYKGMDPMDQLIVEKLIESNYISLLVASRETCEYAPAAKNIIVLGTQEFDGKEHRLVDYSLNEILEMLGCCSDEKSNSCNAFILTSNSKLEYYQKFLNEGLPVESYMNLSLQDMFMNEVSSGLFTSRQACIDWITFTYFYRRLQLNPSFYDVKDTTHIGISEYLSELVENTLSDLEEAKLIELNETEDSDNEQDSENEEEEIQPLNGCMIAAHYNVSYQTMKQFNSLSNKTKMRGILEVITSSAELESLPIRRNEDSTLLNIYNNLPLKISEVDFDSPFTKAFILLQAHFSRIPLPTDLKLDQKFVLSKILNILYACIDHLSSEGYLNAINAMDISQMVLQASWNKESPLKQIPNFDNQILERCKAKSVETVYDIMSLEDEERTEILRLDDEKLSEVAEFVNKYPNIEITYEIDLSEPLVSNEPKELTIKLERDEEMEDLDAVCPRFPFPKTESWWIVIGDANSRQLYAIKKTTIAKEYQELKVEFSVPNVGQHKLSIWCMCDSYLDADKEVSFDVDVQQGEESD